LVLGSNAITAYLISELLPGVFDLFSFHAGGKKVDPERWVYFHLFMRIPDSGWRALAYSITYAAVCFIPVWVLYRKKIFLKI
ncbi:MAG: hypothetical protein ACRD25_10765, partial [Terracidiphilus sp.]